MWYSTVRLNKTFHINAAKFTCILNQKQLKVVLCGRETTSLPHVPLQRGLTLFLVAAFLNDESY